MKTKRTTIANGAIETIKIEAEAGLDIFGAMFKHVDFNLVPERTSEDWMWEHTKSKSYYYPREKDDSQFSAKISKINKDADLPSRDEVFKNEEMFTHEYFEISHENKDSEYYCLEIIQEGKTGDFTYSAYVKNSDMLNGNEGGIHGFESLGEIKAELKDWTAEIMGQIGREDPMEFSEYEYQIYTKSNSGAEKDVETVPFSEFYDFEAEKAVA